jgi:hypothetical protein
VGGEEATGRPAGGAGQHPQGRNAEKVSAPARVAARRGGPKGERRPPHRRGELQTTRSGRRSPGPISAAQGTANPRRKMAPSHGATQAGGVAASRAHGKAVAPKAQRRGSKRARDRRPSDKERGESASGSARKRRALKSAKRERARPKPLPLISTARQRRPAMLIVTRKGRDPARGSVGAQRR